MAGNGDSFLELYLDLFQTAAVKPVIEAARANRRGIIFLSAAPKKPSLDELLTRAVDDPTSIKRIKERSMRDNVKRDAGADAKEGK